MNIIAFSGSARIDGNTAILLGKVIEGFKAQYQKDFSYELIQIANENISSCKACYKCVENKDYQCVIKSDPLNDYIKKVRQADVILLASPTYFADITSNIKALIDRLGFVARANDNFLKRKIGAGIIAVRRAGAIHALDSLNHFFLISEMILVGSNYWNIGIGRNKGDVLADEEGIQTMLKLGENIAWLLEKLV